MIDRRVAILDASKWTHWAPSAAKSSPLASKAAVQEKESEVGKGKEKANENSTQSGKDEGSSSDSSSFNLFRPIPNFSDIVRDIIRDVCRTLLQQRLAAAAAAAVVPHQPISSASTPIHTAPSPTHTYTAPPTPSNQSRDPRLQLREHNQANAHGIPGLTASAASPRSHPPTPTLTASTVPLRSNPQSLQGLAQAVISP